MGYSSCRFGPSQTWALGTLLGQLLRDLRRARASTVAHTGRVSGPERLTDRFERAGREGVDVPENPPQPLGDEAEASLHDGSGSMQQTLASGPLPGVESSHHVSGPAALERPGPGTGGEGSNAPRG